MTFTVEEAPRAEVGTPTADVRATVAGGKRPSWLALVGALALVEYLALSFLVDGYMLAEALDLPLIEWAAKGAPAGITIAAAAALFLLPAMRPGRRSDSRIAEPGSDARREPLDRRRLILRFVAHAASVALFLGSAVALGWGLLPSGATRALFGLVFLLSAFAAAITLVRAALPGLSLRPTPERLVEASRPVGVGLAAFACGWAFEAAWEVLAVTTVRFAASLLSPFGDRVVASESDRLIGIAPFEVHIAPECSGSEGLGLMLVLVSAYLFHFRRSLRFPAALLALPLSLLGAFTANAIRIAVLVVVGRFVSAEVAVGGFHSKAGWVLFSAVALGTILFLHRFVPSAAEGDRREDEAPRIGPYDTPTARHLLPLLVSTGVAMLTGLFSEGPSLAAPVLAGLSAGAALLWISPLDGRDLLGVDPLAIATGVGVYGVWIAATLLTGSIFDPELEFALAELSPLGFAAYLPLRLLALVIVVPVVEELAFRGFLMRFVEDRDFTRLPPRRVGALGIGLSSFAFALLHGQVLGALGAGLAYGLLYRKTGRLSDAAWAHGITNALLGLEALAFGHYGLL